jgi:hypothetical protein
VRNLCSTLITRAEAGVRLKVDATCKRVPKHPEPKVQGGVVVALLQLEDFKGVGRSHQQQRHTKNSREFSNRGDYCVTTEYLSRIHRCFSVLLRHGLLPRPCRATGSRALRHPLFFSLCWIRKSGEQSPFRCHAKALDVFVARPEMCDNRGNA